ncbi:TIGR04024 family LLM class F420-dependent oxidoreductase [Halomarina halobia]|uniref:TIGR04024 family LLM class F420-dependent oxidoreductase n=1 Tax=Halomarina halobia TaxID=3033386 RepID=A0ABD6AD14_9EURY|nr:TIGR04024 family LLM class F420-dependent oxidoreductase [Halomarina sp. PSR21]
MSKDFETDVTLTPDRHSSLQELGSVAQDAEKLGFAVVGFGETTGWDSVVVLTVLAEQTTTIGIADDVIGPFSRSPSQISQAAASIQSLAQGRHRLGLGTSSPALVEGWHGLSFERPLRRLRETIDIVKRAAAGENVTYDGQEFTPEGFQLDLPTPIEIPIDVAALGPKGVELTGRFADGWVPQLFTPAGLEHRLNDLRRGAELGNRDPNSLRTSVLLRACALEDGDRARQLGRQHVAFMISLYGPFYQQSIAEQGYVEMVEEVRGHWQDGDREAAVAAVDDEALDGLVACGTPEEVNAIIDEFAAIDGCDAVRIGWIGPADDEAIEMTMRAVAPANR